MDILKTVLMILFAIDCIVLTAIVLLQEGKSAGLGTISGAAESYWGQNKGRSMEGTLVKMLEEYIDYYNNKRLQRNLGILTPMEKHEIYLQAA